MIAHFPTKLVVVSRGARCQQLNTSQTIRRRCILNPRDDGGMEDVVQGRGLRASRAQYVHRVVHAATRRQQSGNVVDGRQLVVHNDAEYIRKLVTRSMPGRGGGGGAVRLRHAEKTISFVLSPFSRT